MENNDTVTIEMPTDQSGLPPSNPHIHNYNVDKGNGVFACECGESVSLATPEKPPKAPAVPNAGLKCSYCENKEKIQTLADEYVNKHSKQGEKMTIPFIQELAVVLGITRKGINDWVKKKVKDTDILEHPEFVETIERLMTIQELRLLQRTLGRYNPTGAIFQLKTNHGYMESEKRVVTGDSNEPLIVQIVEDKKVPDSE